VSKEGRLNQEHWKVRTVPQKYCEAQSLENALELCQYVNTEDKIESMKNGKSKDDEKLMQIAAGIEMKACRKCGNLKIQQYKQQRKNTQVVSKGSPLILPRANV